MKNIMKALLLAATPITILAATTLPAAAQSKQGIAVVDTERAGAQSTAFTNGMAQIKTTYGAQITQLNNRTSAINTDIQAKKSALEAAARAAGQNPTPAQQQSLAGQYEALQQAGANGQAELQRLSQPIMLAQEYVRWQVASKLPQAIKTAMSKANVDLVISADATEGFAPSVEITQQVIAELNALLPSASITPPAGWQPGGSAGARPAASGGR